MQNKLEYIDLLGKPFRLGGRGPNYYDCWGLCIEIGKRAGILYPTNFTPKETIDQDVAIRTLRDNDFIKLDKPEPFCIVTFAVTPPYIDHCGIVTEDCKHFIHIMRESSVTKQRIDHKILAKRRDGFYRLRTDADN